jgi:hypothetical protein
MTFLPVNTNRGGRPQLQIFYVEPDDLGYSCTGIVHGRKHDGIAMTAPGTAIRRIKNGGDFFLREIRDREMETERTSEGKVGLDMVRHASRRPHRSPLIGQGKATAVRRGKSTFV